ncbi:MAG: hypothetical protein ABSC24_11935 [Verrucomicrobiota bacterium]|jgi:hypothetical protein
MKNSSAQAHKLAQTPPAGRRSSSDFAVSYHGTISLFHPLTNRADDWLRLHCPPDGEHQYLGKALAIEHHFVSDIIQLATDDGLLPAVPNQGRN